MVRVGGSGAGGAFAIPTPELVLSSQPCSEEVEIGDWVRWDGANLIPALADSLLNANVFGLVESKASDTLCTVRVGGVSSSLFSGLDNSKLYFLSDQQAGEMTQQGVNIPTDPGHIVLVLGKPVDEERFLVSVGLPLKRS